jgi:probable phosphoglycerate mutase
MEILLIRHGQPEWVREGMQIDNPPLTELGHRQAKRMAEALAGERFDEVYCSPLVRARQTAEPLFAALGREETIAPWLEEIRDPAWHGTPREKAVAAYEEMHARPVEERWHGLDGGESIRDFTARIRAGATEFLGERGVVRAESDLPLWHVAEHGARIALVAHAGTNSVTIAHLLGLQPTPWEWDRFVIGHTSISRLESLQLSDASTFSLSKLSDLEHLSIADRTR